MKEIQLKLVEQQGCGRGLSMRLVWRVLSMTRRSWVSAAHTHMNENLGGHE